MRSDILKFSRGKPLDLIVVDYLQMIEGHAGPEANVDTTDRALRYLKAIAMELNLPVLVLSQLTDSERPIPPSRLFRNPDLPAATRVAPHADIEMILDQADAFEENLRSNDGFPDQPYEGIVRIVVTKNRHGSTGGAYLRFDERLLSFRDLEIADA